jgi:integrase
MLQVRRGARRRIGRVSLYVHHRSYHVYYRENGSPVRTSVGSSEPIAECTASLLNAQLVADDAGLKLSELVATVLNRSAHSVSTPSEDDISVLTVAALRKLFLGHHEHVQGSATTTISRYAAATEHLDRYADKEQLKNALSLRVTGFIEYLRRVDISPNGHANTARRKLRDKGVKYILETCRSMYRFGVRCGHLPKQADNPFDDSGIGSLRIRDAKPIFVFSAEQELAFFTVCDAWAFAVHFTLAKTGMRPGELVHLLIDDVDLKEGWLHVRGKSELGWTTKTNRDRRLPLVPELISLLSDIIGERGAGPLFLRASLFSNVSSALPGNRTALATISRLRLGQEAQRLGRALTRVEAMRVYRGVWRDAGAVDIDQIRTSLIRIAANLGLDATCPKSWRHTFATLLQEGEVDPLVRQEVMGHAPSLRDQSALGMTGVYTHTHPETLRRQVLRALRLRPASLAIIANHLNVGNARQGCAQGKEAHHD